MTDLDALFLHRSSALVRAGLDDRHLRRAAAAGRLVRVVPGLYVEPEPWNDLSPEERHALRVMTVLARASERLVASHASAAALHGLPLLGQPPAVVHVLDPARSTGARSGTLVRHASRLHDDEVTTARGTRVTTPARTALDLCLGCGLADGVAALDHGLREGLLTLDEVAACLRRRPRARGRRTAEVALALADARSASPLESTSAVTMHLLGAPRPERQKTFRAPSGRFVATVDFWWPQYRAVGEADGHGKYLDPDLRDGRSAGQVVIDEKSREDEVRSLVDVDALARWGWSTARSPRLLAEKLTLLGLPLDHPPTLRDASTRTTHRPRHHA